MKSRPINKVRIYWGAFFLVLVLACMMYQLQVFWGVWFLVPALIGLVYQLRIYWGVLLIVLAVAGMMYQFLVAGHLEQTSALFMGIATVLALGLSLLPLSENATGNPAPKSTTGNIVLGTMIALALSMIVFREGAVCILMATPLFLTIGAFIGQGLDAVRNPKNKARMRMVLALIFLPLSLEGVTDELSFNRSETVTVSRVVALSPDRVEQNLARMPDLSKTLPAFLQLGFPEPQHYSGADLKVGAQRCFHVPARENLSGEVCWTIEQRGSNHVLFKLVKDESKIAHWMTWRTAKVEWSAEGGGQRDAGRRIAADNLKSEIAPRESTSESTVSQLPPLQRGNGRTRVVVTLKFWRELDPAWYFSPLERYAVGLTGGYLIEAYLGQ